LPKDPPTLPKQDGTGGTFNFQLHPAFWFGMAMCDTQSAPNFTTSCEADTDANIFDNADNTKADYIGHHPGTAFMEMQFYPPGWIPWPAGNSCDATHYCAALNIDSLSVNSNTGQGNNASCGGAIEYVNFAFITKDGVPPGPPSPLLQNNSTFTPNADTLFYNPGDLLRVVLRDTPNGLKITITDLTTGESGSMTASAANGFAQILFDPSGTNCDPATHNLPYNFHPMYATSSEHTRVPWAAHSYNIAFSDEIGHFEYCNAVDSEGGNCTQAGVNDPAGVDRDDFFCFSAASSTRIQIGGCFGTDVDFDGPEYGLTWPGTLSNRAMDASLHAHPVSFTSPLFRTSEGETLNYSRVAFETDLPRIEFATNPPCQRHFSNPADPSPGTGCVDPPVGASFYPIFTTGQIQDGENCTWQLGGALIPGTTNTFGGTSTSEYGSLLLLAYPGSNGAATLRYNDFRQVLNTNPCLSQQE